MQLELSSPRMITFVVSAVLALLAAVIHYAHIDVPFTRTGFSVLLAGYLVLAAGNLFRDI